MWYFVLPADRHLPSGGNIYNQKVIQSLSAFVETTEIGFEQYQHSVHHTISANDVVFIDSLFINQLHTFLQHNPLKGYSVFIAHHLESLYPTPPATANDVFNTIEKAVLQAFDAFLATSNFMGNYLAEKFTDKKIIVAPPATDLNMNPLVRDTNRVDALLVGNVIERKGVLELLDMLAQQTIQHTNWHLTIVGRHDIEPEYAKRCLHVINQHPILQTCVTMKGSVEPQQMVHFYEKSNVFVSASAMETFGMAIHEAATAQIPLLIRRGGYSEQHLQHYRGKAFDTTSELSVFLVSLIHQPNLLNHFAPTQLSAQEPYTWHSVAQQIYRYIGK